MTPTIPSWDTLFLVMPEIWLVLGMCAVILVPFVKRESYALPVWTAIIALGLGIFSTLQTLGIDRTELVFSGTLVIDPFSQFFKLLLLVFTLLIVVQWWLLSKREVSAYDTPDYLCLLLGAAFGMALMSSAANMLTVFVAMESASFPSFALAGFRKRHRISTEASLKYVIFGAAASAIMIYGMSLVYGVAGSLDLYEIARHAAGVPYLETAKAMSGVAPLEAQAALDAARSGFSPLMAMGLMAIFAGFAFKLSAVPLHFWCPDVFEGAPTDVTTFLSVASKAAAVALLVRFLAIFGDGAQAAALAAQGLPEAVEFTATRFWGLGVGVGLMGVATATLGNLVALHQTNIKRLLAYSSIAHAGYMIMGASMMTWAIKDAQWSETVAGALLFYMFVYLFMNLGAFTVAGLITNQTGSQDIRDYAGMFHRSDSSRTLTVVMALFLLSLFGMPGLGGFIGKVLIMAGITAAGTGSLFLIAALLINTAISLYYYLRPIIIMTMVKDTENRPPFEARGAAWAVLTVCAIAAVATGIDLGGVTSTTRSFAVLHRYGIGWKAIPDVQPEQSTVDASPTPRVLTPPALQSEDGDPLAGG